MKEIGPFCLLYTENVDSKMKPIETVYDHSRDLNMVRINGKQVPVVCLDQMNVGTKTSTFVERETTDDDVGLNDAMMGTRTITELSIEDTDSDFHEEYSSYLLGTITETKVQRESTDSD